MYYKFSQMTQSISAAFQQTAMGNSLTQKASKPMNINYEYEAPKQDVATVTFKQKKGSKNIVHSIFPDTPRYRKLMEKQRRFLVPDGKLVWQKLPLDMPLYYSAVLMCAAGVGLTLYSVYVLAQPPQND